MAKNLLKSTKSVLRESFELKSNLEENETETREVKSTETAPDCEQRQQNGRHLVRMTLRVIYSAYILLYDMVQEWSLFRLRTL